MKLTPAYIASLHEGGSVASLQTLNVARKGIEQVIGLENCPKLQRLDLSDNDLTTLTGLVANTELKWLSVKGNHLTSLKPLEEHEKLSVLNASHNELTTVEGVAGSATQLRALILNNNALVDVAPLARLKGLTALVLSHNHIETLGKAMHTMTELTKLSLSHNKLRVLGPALKKCYSLTELRLSHNRIKSLPEELLHNPRLRILDAGGNLFSSWKDVEALRQLPSLSNVNLMGSPLSEEDDYEERMRQMVPNLQVLDGRKVVEGFRGKKKVRSLDNIQDEASDAHSRKRTATDQSGGDSEDSEEEPQKRTQPSESKLKKQKVKAAEDKAHTRFPKDSPSTAASDETEEPFLAQVLKQASATNKDKPVSSGLLRVQEATPKKGAGGKLKGSAALQAMMQITAPQDAVGDCGASGWGDETPIGLLQRKLEVVHDKEPNQKPASYKAKQLQNKKKRDAEKKQRKEAITVAHNATSVLSEAGPVAPANPSEQTVPSVVPVVSKKNKRWALK